MSETYGIKWWLYRIIDNTARILAETAEHGDEIDILRAKSSKERAEKRLAERDENLNFTRAQMSLKSNCPVKGSRCLTNN